MLGFFSELALACSPRQEPSRTDQRKNLPTSFGSGSARGSLRAVGSTEPEARAGFGALAEADSSTERSTPPPSADFSISAFQLFRCSLLRAILSSETKEAICRS